MPHVHGLDGRWRNLLLDARWAPSPHNVQPWRLHCRNDGSAGLVCSHDRLLPITDPGNVFTAVGLGCFVESLAIAASARGLALTASTTGASVDGTEAVVELSLADGPTDPLGIDLLHQRRTSRLSYDGRPVDEELLDELAGIAAARGHEWRASSDPELVDWVVSLNRETLFLDMADANARQELGLWLRFSSAEAASRRDGFSPAQLGFPGWLLRLFFTRHGLLELPGIKQATHALYGRTMRGTRTVAWLRGPFESLEDGLRAGRLLMRLWLTMTRDGVRLHPFGSVVTNATANARLQERIGSEGSTVWLVMRLGRSAEPPRSFRFEADELLVA